MCVCVFETKTKRERVRGNREGIEGCEQAGEV